MCCNRLRTVRYSHCVASKHSSYSPSVDFLPYLRGRPIVLPVRSLFRELEEAVLTRLRPPESQRWWLPSLGSGISEMHATCGACGIPGCVQPGIPQGVVHGVAAAVAPDRPPTGRGVRQLCVAPIRCRSWWTVESVSVYRTVRPTLSS